MTWNIEAYAVRLYTEGHIPADFAEMLPDCVIVSPIRPPGILGGLHIPEKAVRVAGQFALTHKVEALPSSGGGALDLKVGDIVKCREAHLDPIDPQNGNLLVTRLPHIWAVVKRATDRG